ncbi:rpl22 [Symbiodinium natans]|uniref:Rpl22 protein n=1 Tax=Symbiodinium natans TaxID=878477 RepID=A0A812K877_9DINO|nr:rpl22 [Symbiodinium natans]
MVEKTRPGDVAARALGAPSLCEDSTGTGEETTPVDFIGDEEAALAGIVSRLEPTRRDIIQAVQAHHALWRFGRVLRRAPTARHRASYPTDRIDQFWSHSWHGSTWNKVLTAIYLSNGLAASLLATVGAALLMVCVGTGTLPEKIFSQEPQYPEHSMWCTVLGFLLYLLVLFFWRPSKSIFLDVLCIDQEDEQRKMEGVISMGAFVKCSDVLLVLWDSTYTRRLWCVFEMAAFMHSHPDFSRANIVIRPTILGPCLISLTVALSCCLHAVGLIPRAALNHEDAIIWPIMFLCLIVVFYLSVAALRAYYRSVETLQREMSQFCAEECLCWCCSTNHVSPTGDVLACDRRIVFQCVRKWFGSLAAFEEKVRTDVVSCLADQLSGQIFTYARCATSAVPVLWHFLDRAGTHLHRREWRYVDSVLMEIFRGLAWGLGVIPIFIAVGARLCSCLQKRRTWRVVEALTNSFILAFFVLMLLGALELEQQCWRFEQAYITPPGELWTLLPGSIIFTVITLSMAGMIFRYLARKKHVARAPAGQLSA